MCLDLSMSEKEKDLNLDLNNVKSPGFLIEKMDDIIPPKIPSIDKIATPETVQKLVNMYGKDQEQQFAVLLLAHNTTQQVVENQGALFAEAINLLRKQIDILAGNQNIMLSWIRNRDPDLAEKLKKIKDEITHDFLSQIKEINGSVAKIQDFLKPQELVKKFVASAVKAIYNGVLLGIAAGVVALIFHHYHVSP